MANDIIGGPEPVVISGNSARLFFFSPLNDLEFSALDSWVSWRLEKKTESLSDVGFGELKTVEGIAQILYQSVHRNESTTVLELANFIGGSASTCDEIFEAWYKLNFLDGANDFEPVETKDIPEGTPAPSSNAMYVRLSDIYGWLPQDIRLLTKYQQRAYCQRAIRKQNALPPMTEAEYFEFMKTFNKKK